MNNSGLEKDMYNYMNDPMPMSYDYQQMGNLDSSLP